MTNHDQLIVFDLDDTLVDTSEVYWQARSRFVRLMADNGFEPTVVLDLFEDIDTTFLTDYGLAPERYGKSMVATCHRLYSQVQRVPEQTLLEEVKSCGNLILENLPVLIEGAYELLTWASDHFDLALLTRGIESFQKRKLRAAAIEHFFNTLRVVDRKDASAFWEVIEATHFTPSSTWVIGDSVKSDMNPGNEAGTRCILFEYSHPEYFWRQEYGTAAKGKFYKVHLLKDAIEILKSPASFSMVSGLRNLRPAKENSRPCGA